MVFVGVLACDGDHDPAPTPGDADTPLDTATEPARWSGAHAASEATAVLSGIGAGDLAGEAVASAGDLDGDGTDDLAVGGFLYPGDGTALGASWVVYGPVAGARSLADADGLIVGEVEGQKTGDTLAGVGDVDGDGLGDLLMGTGAAFQGSQEGAVYLFLGPASGEQTTAEADGSLLGRTRGDHLGRSIARLGDTDGDGVDDVAIGANGGGGGAVFVLSGPEMLGTPDLEAAREVVSSEAYAYFGTTVAGVGDLDGDGLADLAACAYESDEGGVDFGTVYLFSGPIAQSESADADASLVGITEYTGRGLAALDGDGDGWTDLVVGAPASSLGADHGGAIFYARGPFPGARSLEEADGRIDGDEEFASMGEGVASPGDLDADGTPEIAFGAHAHDEAGVSRVGIVYLLYAPPVGVVGNEEADATFVGDSMALGLGRNIGGPGDFDGDGLPDLLVGTQSSEGASVVGGAYVFAGRAPG